MAYRCVKTINGKDYVYEQTSYREGGKVKTRSKYIGPLRETEEGFVERTLRRKSKEPTYEDDVAHAMVMVERVTGRTVEEQMVEMDREYEGRDGRVPTLSIQNAPPDFTTPAAAPSEAAAASGMEGEQSNGDEQSADVEGAERGGAGESGEAV